MNQNFQILIKKINELQTRLDEIENINTFNYNADHITSGTISLERLPVIPAENIAGLVPNALEKNNPNNEPLIFQKNT